jgi:MarR family transcriptional regulator, organic hydroperoxide resistance regulator
MKKPDLKKGTQVALPASTDPDYNLWVLLRQVRDAMMKARDKELEKHGMSSIQAAVLFNIYSIGSEATPAEISRRLVREPHSVSGLLNRMEKHGLIKRVKDMPKRNMVRVILTEKGERAYQLTMKRVTMHEIMKVLTEDERKALWGPLQKLRDRSLKIAGIGHELPFPPHWSEDSPD